MKITNIQATPIRVDTTRTSAWALGQGRSIARTVIEIETDEGAIGIGEAPRGDTAEIINTIFKERLVGLSVDDIRKARALCLPRDRDFGLMDDVRARMKDLGMTPVGKGSPAELQKFLESEIGRWGKVVEAAGVAGTE